jgi:hypothetical protein
MSCYQNQPLDLSCHKNRLPSPSFTSLHDRSLVISPPSVFATVRCFRRRPDSSSDNDDGDGHHDHHQSPDSAVDAGCEPRRRSLGSSDEPFTERSRSRSPHDGDEEEEEEGATEQRRNFGYDIGPRKRLLSKFFTDPAGELTGWRRVLGTGRRELNL